MTMPQVILLFMLYIYYGCFGVLLWCFFKIIVLIACMAVDNSSPSGIILKKKKIKFTPALEVDDAAWSLH